MPKGVGQAMIAAEKPSPKSSSGAPLSAPAPVTSALDLIGRTPVLELTGMFDCGPCRLFTKLESANPGGSIKDRIARTMIEAAEADGRLPVPAEPIRRTKLTCSRRTSRACAPRSNSAISCASIISAGWNRTGEFPS